MKLGRKINNVTFTRSGRSSKSSIWIISIIVTVFFVWSAFAPLDEVVRGIGRVVPVTQNQVIQNLEGGIVQEIFVTEGDVVEPGQVLAEMDSTRFQSAFQELRNQYWALRLRLERLAAEAEPDSDFVPSAEISKEAPEHATSELQIFLARRAQLIESMNGLRDMISLKEQEISALRAMVERSAVPLIELNREEQTLVEARSRLTSVKTEFEVSRAQEYSEVLSTLRQVEEQMRAREDQLIRTAVRSPVRGVVNKIMATTIGGVAQPGDALIEILSLEDDLRIEGRIAPKDIGFVYVGMPATIKLSAFDFSLYGTLEGKVVHVGADTVLDNQQREPMPYYEVFIEPFSTSLDGPSGKVSIRPGMQAQIELTSGQKTVLQYILSPLFKATEALSER